MDTVSQWVVYKENVNDDPFVDYYRPDELPECRAVRKTFVDTMGHLFFQDDMASAQQMGRGQLTVYGLAPLGFRFHTFAFCMLSTGKQGRFVRWERAGTVREIEFSVEPARSLSSSYLERVCETLRLLSSTPLFEFMVPNGEGTRSYFRPPCPSSSWIYRSTHALPLCDQAKGQGVYLTGTWRIDESEMQPEGEVYERLKQAGVHGLTPFECGGDVGHMTITQDLVLEDWSYVREPITGHVHYRMVLGVVGRKLAEFKSTKELVQGALGALIAHAKAYGEARILHRDVSPGNIILTDDGQGLLIDWDMSKPLEVKNRRRRDRTGTWQFMSAALLQNPDKEHEVKDDLESFLHVLTWCTVRYVPNILDPEERRHYLAMFDESTSFTHKVVGGDLKANGLGATNTYLIDFKLEQASPLIDLLKTLSSVFAPLYSLPPFEAPFESEESSKAERDRFERRHQQTVQWLSNPQGFITTFENCLRSPGWPGNDGSVPNVVAPPATLTHRQLRLEMDRIMSRGSHFFPSLFTRVEAGTQPIHGPR